MTSNSHKKLALFGATGSIGLQTLDVISKLQNFEIAVLTAGKDWQGLAELALKYKPEVVAIADSAAYEQLKDALSGKAIKIIAGSESSAEAAAEAEYDICLNAIVGVAGLLPSYHSLVRGIDLALANKESLVLAGELLQQISKENDAAILPVDSEHSAIFQCLQGEKQESIKRIILTASGGPFREWSIERINSASREDALNHPTWKMGPKITIDSATLMNKGLEVIEAYFLFNMPVENIEVRIHPVSIVHSMIEFRDGSFKAQLGKPDMRIPIIYALCYPERVAWDRQKDDPVEWPALEFYNVDFDKFPCLGLAFRALEQGGTATAVLNGADEAAVGRFLDGSIGFGDISRVIASALYESDLVTADSIDAVLRADSQARDFVMNWAP